MVEHHFEAFVVVHELLDALDDLVLDLVGVHVRGLLTFLEDAEQTVETVVLGELLAPGERIVFQCDTQRFET